MKKIIFIAATLALGLVYSCDKRNNDLISTPIELKATMEVPTSETKTHSEGVNVLWDNGDKIALYFGNSTTTKALFTLTSGAGTKSATFTGTPQESSNTRYAFYPHESVTNKVGNNIEFKLPTVQKRDNTTGFSAGSNPMLAYTTTGGNLEFKNLCAMIRLQLTGTQTIKKIVVTSVKSKLSGWFYVAATSADPQIEKKSDELTSNYVTLEISPSITLTSTPTDFYIMVPPVLFPLSKPDTYTFTIVSDDGKEFSKSTKVVQLLRSGIYGSPVLECGTFVLPTYTEGEGEYSAPGVAVDLGGTLGTKVFAPVNLGYKLGELIAGRYKYTCHYGKLYQWGRKYGQYYHGTPGGDDAGTTVLMDGPVDFETGQDETRKDEFYGNSTGIKDWSNAWFRVSWNLETEEKPQKSTHDPCPVGWRVPTSNELSALGNLSSTWISNGTHGAISNKYYGRQIGSLFLPASGSIKYDKTYINRTVAGLYYSSSSTSSNASAILVSQPYLTMGTTEKANACSIRCIRDY